MIEDSTGQTIEITVKVFGGLKEFFHGGQQHLLLPDRSTVASLLRVIHTGFPDGSTKLTAGLDAGYLNILINGRNVLFLQGNETSLNDGDTVAFLPPVGGG